MSTIRPWALALAQAQIAAPLVFGEALAYARYEAFSPAIATALLGLGVALQVLLFGVHGLAVEDRRRPSWRGRALGREELRGLAAAGLAAAAGASLYLTLEHGRTWMLAGPAAAAALAWAYSSPPIQAARRGFGEVIVGVGAAALPLTAAYAQAGALAAELLPALVPAIVLGGAAEILRSLPDQPADAAAAWRSYAVRYGQWRARRHAIELTLVAALLANLALPELSLALDLVLAAPAAALLVLGARLLGTADAEDPGECARFVALVGAAGPTLLLTWSLALVIVAITAATSMV